MAKIQAIFFVFIFLLAFNLFAEVQPEQPKPELTLAEICKESSADLSQLNSELSIYLKGNRDKKDMLSGLNSLQQKWGERYSNSACSDKIKHTECSNNPDNMKIWKISELLYSTSSAVSFDLKSTNSNSTGVVARSIQSLAIFCPKPVS